MEKPEINQILIDIGLSENEAKIYIASLSLGPTTVLKLSRISGIKRSTAYNVVEDLKEKGLMSIDIKGLKQYYVAESPKKLENILERRKTEFQTKLPELMGMFDLKGGESTIKYYTGIEAMQNIYMETLQEVSPGEDYLVIANEEKWRTIASKFASRYIEARTKTRVKTRVLVQPSVIAEEYKKFAKNYNEQIKILPKGTPINVDILILPKKVITFELMHPHMTVVIENPSIVASHREMFEMLWKMLP